MSAARAFVTLGRGERATAQRVTVHLQPSGVGDIGIELDQGFPLDGRAIGPLARGGVLHWILSQPIGAGSRITVR